MFSSPRVWKMSAVNYTRLSAAPLHYGAAGKQWADFLPRTHRSPVNSGVLTQSIKTHSYGRANRAIPQFAQQFTTLLHIALRLYCSVGSVPPSTRHRTDGCRKKEGGREGRERRGGRSGEVNEIPMRCQGVLAVRCGE